MLKYLNAQRGFYGDFSVYFVFFYKCIVLLRVQ